MKLAGALAALLVLSPLPSRACGINPEANRLAIEKRWVAARPVSPPPAGPWAAWRASFRWEAERRSCQANQRTLAFVCTDMLDCGLGTTSLGALCRAAGDRHPADKLHAPHTATGVPCAHRIPQAFLDALAREGHFTAALIDPGQGPGSGENYALIQHERGTFCLVHGGTGAPAGASARSQLVERGVTDPRLLALAWDHVPAGLPDRAGRVGFAALLFGAALALHGRRAGAVRAVARALVAAALGAAIPPLAESCGLAPGSLAGAPAAAIALLAGFTATTAAVLAVRCVPRRRAAGPVCKTT